MTSRTILSLFLILCSLSVLFPFASAASPSPFTPLVGEVNHRMTVRVVIAGISDINQTQLLWSLEPSIKPNIQSSHSPQGYSEITYGSNFSINYEIITASANATTDLTNYLRSIGQNESVPDYLQSTGYFSSYPDNATYLTLDAIKSENWLNTHIVEFGGLPDNGYSVIVTDVSNISSLYHYYNISYHDLDAGSKHAKYSSNPQLLPIVDWMFSWGGHHSFYYLDLSGGDPNYDYSGVGHIPIQDFQDRLGGQAHFKRNVQTVTEYVADYVSEAIRNLFLPSYVYAPTLASSYQIVVNVFDQTGRLNDINIEDYLSPALVEQAFQKIIPYAKWNVVVHVHRLPDDPGLEDTVTNSILYSSDVRGFGGDMVHVDYYDFRPVYAYLQNHMSQYVDLNTQAVVLPAFEFVFKSGGRFAATWEEAIGDRSQAVDRPTRTFLGVSLGDMVIIGSPERNIFSFGTELSQVTIHELGHTIGLMHPHSFGNTEDYVSSPMSYRTYEYQFSQFDIDAIQRAHADYLLSQVQGIIGVAVQFPLAGAAQNLTQKATSNYERALSNYDHKQYANATSTLETTLNQANQAYQDQLKAVQDLNGSFQSPAVNSILDAANQRKTEGDLGGAFALLVAAQSQASINQSRMFTLAGVAGGIVIGLLLGVGVAYRSGRVRKIIQRSNRITRHRRH